MLNLIQAVAGRPWAIQAEVAFLVRDMLAREGIAGLRCLAELKDIAHAFDGPAARAESATRGASTTTSIAVIPMMGTLTQRAQAIGSVGVTRSTASLAKEIRAMAADPGVDAIVLEVDSPGGEVFGVPEAFASIRESARMKPVVAHANSVAGSAALYLASAASEVWITPSGKAGSVGVFSLHVDKSSALAKEGEAWEFIVASRSPYKVEGNAAGPLSAEARQNVQRDVDAYMDMFIRDLAIGRGIGEQRVETGFGGGRMLGATEAVAVGMADQVGTFDQAVRRAAELSRKRGGMRASVGARAGAAPSADTAELEAIARLAGLNEKEIR
jgi:signal peptide peptidase SppA